jgi:hypothetical protein
LPLGNIGTPSLPVGGALAVRFEALLLFAEVLLILNENHGGCVGWSSFRGKLLLSSQRVLQDASGVEWQGRAGYAGAGAGAGAGQQAMQ